MIPWTAAVGRQLLAPQPDRGEQQRSSRRARSCPRHGSDAACDWRPVKTTSTSSDASGWRLDVVAVARVVQERRVEALEQPVVDHDLLAAPPLLGGRAEEDDLAGQLVARSRPGRSPRRPRTPPSCCGRSRGRGPGSASYSARIPIRGPVAAPPARERGRGRRSRGCPAGCSTAKPWRADRLRDPAPPPGPPRRRAPGRRGSGATGRGSRRARPRPRRRRAALASANGSAAGGDRRRSGESVTSRRLLLRSAERVDLGDDDDRGDEQDDRQLERVRRAGGPRGRRRTGRPTPPRRTARIQSPW